MSRFPTRSLRSLSAAARSISSSLWLHHAHSLIAAAEKKTSLMQRSNRVWSWSCGLQDLLRTIQWLIVSRIWIISDITIDCARSCDMWLLQTNEPILATVSWKWGRRPFSGPSLKKTQSMPKRDMFDMFVSLSKESMPCVKSKPPLPTRSLRSLRAAVCSNSSALCLHHAHPFVTAAEKRPVSCREAEGLVTKLWFGDQELCNILIVFLWLLQRKLLASVGWKWGCQPFRRRCSLDVTNCRKEICSTCLFKESFCKDIRLMKRSESP